MTKFQILNMASELRRAANWLYRGQEEKLPLIEEIIDQGEKDIEVKKVLDHFKIKKDFKNKKWLGEQLLVSSIRLKNISNNF